jgi:uncharacterized protein
MHATDPRARAATFGFLVAFLLASVIAASALTFPQLTGRVVDEAGILDVATRTVLGQKLADFEAKTTGQLVVVTLKSLQGTSIEDYGYQLGRHWGIGPKEKNSGALLIVAPNERKVRIEVGYGLEGNLTDAISRLIIENSILPRFRANDFAGGINRGVDDIIQVLTTGADEFRERAKVRPDNHPRFVNILVLLLLFIVVYSIIRNLSQRGRWPTAVPGGQRRGRGGPVVIPAPIPWDHGSGSSDWGGSGGGGYSGGGGSFGGGGSSGSW